jgi:hypothetical protein
VVGVVAAFGGWSEATARLGQYLRDLGLGPFLDVLKEIYGVVAKLVGEIYAFAKSILGLKESVAGGDNAKRVKAFREEYEKLEAAAREANRSVGDLGSGTSRSFEKGERAVQQATRTYTDYSKSVGSAASGAIKMADANGNLVTSFNGITYGAQSAGSALGGLASAYSNAASAAYDMNSALAASTAAINNGTLDRGGFGPSTAGQGSFDESTGYAYDRFGISTRTPSTEEYNRRRSDYAQKLGYKLNKSGQIVGNNLAPPKELGSFSLGDQIVVQGQRQTVAPGGGELYQRLLAYFQATGDGNPEQAALVQTRAARHSIAAGNGFAQFVADERGLAPGFLQLLRRFEAGGAPAGYGNYNPAFATRRSFPAGGFGGGNAAYRGAFAYGGSFQVGGSGGTDSQLVAFHASPDERVTITKPGQNSGGSVRPVNIVFNVQAQDADSFRRSKTQLLSDLGRGITNAVRSL